MFFITSFFYWVGVLTLVPYLLLVAYGAYGCPEQNLKTKYNAKWALVTGGSSGIGAAIVRKFASQGLNVVVVALNDAVLEAFKETIAKEYPQVEFRFVGCDLSNANGNYLESIKQVTNDIDVQILCNNAGFITTGGFADVPFERDMANFHTNVTSGLTLTHYFADQMLNKGLRGLITFTSSSAAFIPNPMSALYASTKIFLTTFAASIAAELAEAKIDVLAIHPSPINSNFYSNAGKMSALLSAQKLSSPPSVIADTICRNAGKVVIADQGPITVVMRILTTKLMDWNVFTEIMKLGLRYNGDYKAMKVIRSVQAKKEN
ncbi:Very-long-chain 3-oxoacyl-CoA reductase [Choanephora cucurbitarum]|uniref:Very-long-chain 3-oxoacyl-CoA reductase n=1 Tax=Choanephora cucurbitarum TaxID=101091 RepID=A0A1C7N3Q8_9FUNG|nr:Very-long-chain 3-oxoacyl-CoA reductase [Choanephora cucurbitarum]